MNQNSKVSETKSLSLTQLVNNSIFDDEHVGSIRNSQDVTDKILEKYIKFNPHSKLITSIEVKNSFI